MAPSATETKIVNWTDSVSVRELSPGFGAEIRGLNFTDGVSEEGKCLIENSLTKFGVVVVRASKLNDDTHIELARMFGELDDVKPYIKSGRKNRLKYDELFDVSNVEEDGSIVAFNSPRGEANKGNGLFHVDSSFNPRRAGYSLLLAHELPPKSTGGNTAFADTRTAYDDLDQETKSDLLAKDYVAAHSVLHSRKLAAPEYFADTNPEEHPMGRHKLLQRHEKSGRLNLYLAAHIHHIEGLEPRESQELFERLFNHATQDKYVVEIEWEEPTDLVVWDNTCTMHRAIGGEFQYKYRRDMRRATVHDSSIAAWGLNEKSDVRQGLP